MVSPLGRFPGILAEIVALRSRAMVRQASTAAPSASEKPPFTKERIAEIRKRLEEQAAQRDAYKKEHGIEPNVRLTIHDVYPDTLTPEELERVIARNKQISAIAKWFIEAVDRMPPRKPD